METAGQRSSVRAMKLALEALEDYVEEYGPHEKDSGAAYVINALRQALETEQAMKDAIVGGTGVMLDGKRIDPATIYKEEPVAWIERVDTALMAELIEKALEEKNHG